MTKNQKTTTWLLFLTLCLFFPSLVYIFIAIGLVPMSYFIYSVYGEIVPLFTAPNFNLDHITISGILLFHIAIYCFIYFRLAKFISSKIIKINSAPTRMYVTLAIICTIIIGSILLPIYFMAGDGHISPTNIIGVF